VVSAPRRANQRRVRVLILVENLSVPFDRRVWQESRALIDAGYEVTVICPKGHKYDTESDVIIDGVRILRYSLRPAKGGPVGYLREYAVALANTFRLSLKVFQRGSIDLVQACNPPDVLFLAVLYLKFFGARFVFDHHDLVPELFRSRFEGRGILLYRLMLLLERMTFALADGVISTNESYRQIAIKRGKLAPERAVVGQQYLTAYLGVMGPQDGVDYALRALAHLRNEFGRYDVHSIFMGSGDAINGLMALTEELGLTDCVEFTGRVSDEFVRRCLSTADVCLSPDPLNPLNNVSSMNKVVEYMAMGRSLVSFELVEARVSAGGAALYAPANDIVAFAKCINELLCDSQRRHQMGEYAYRRVCDHLSWSVSRENLLRFYGELMGDWQSVDAISRAQHSRDARGARRNRGRAPGRR
jgi:glycosyltransferase involved in cell wall biosynthesis